jgi:cytochrome P450
VQALKEMDGIVYGWIHERLEKMKDPSFVPPSDLLHLLLTATDDEGTKTEKKKSESRNCYIDGNPGKKLDLKQVRDESYVVLMAGQETTASGLAWSLYWLGLNPQVCSVPYSMPTRRRPTHHAQPRCALHYLAERTL